MNPNNRSGRNSPNGDNPDGDNTGLWTTLGLVGAGAAAVGGLIWALSSSRDSNTPGPKTTNDNRRHSSSSSDTGSSSGHTNNNNTLYSRLSSLLHTMDTSNESSAPENPVINNLNSLLADIHVRYVALKRDEFQLHYNVFDNIFGRLHKTMKEVDPYYNRYSSTVQFAGSHYDNLRIKKPDEFDMDIVIGLPLNIRTNSFVQADSDIIIEATSPAYVQLKTGVQFAKLPMRDGTDWLINKAAYEWKDERGYILRSKFIDWFKSVVIKALNRLETMNGRPSATVNGVTYTIRTSESGPAITLIMENALRQFRLDVDLVPALKFFEDRWPVSRAYCNIPPHCKQETWTVVPKPNKAGESAHERNRSWRIALHNQERQLMHDAKNLKQAIRLIKQLRDVQGMKEIASYYIKTLFYLEIEERSDPLWGRNNPATIFTIMVKKLYAAINAGRIPYYWNKNYNLIGHVNIGTLSGYASKLAKLIELLDRPNDVSFVDGRYVNNYKLVAKYLLSPNDFAEYNYRYLNI